MRVYFCNLYSVYICKRKLYMNPFPPYSSVAELKLAGRYITNTHIEPLLSNYNHSIIGHSTSGLPIYRIRMGTGNTKVSIWSQMHGNESTTTKSLFGGYSMGTSLCHTVRKRPSKTLSFILTPGRSSAVTLFRSRRPLFVNYLGENLDSRFTCWPTS